MMRDDLINPITHSSHDNGVLAQADAIWNKEILPILQSEENKKVALLYAANQEQAEKLYEGYTDPSIDLRKIFSGGSGQAKVFELLAKKIEDEGYRDRVHILPIPTSKHGGDNRDKGNHVELHEIDTALANVAYHIGCGFDVKGFKTSDHKFSLGAQFDSEKKMYRGTSAGWNNKHNVQIIQKEDGTCEQEYIGNKTKFVKQSDLLADTVWQEVEVVPKGGKRSDPNAMSQGEYTENNLVRMSGANFKFDKRVEDAYAKGIQDKDAHGQSFDIKKFLEKESIIAALEKYVKRIDSHKKEDGKSTNFEYGFFVYKQERAKNREANCELAKILIAQIKDTPVDKLGSLFSEKKIQENRPKTNPTFSLFPGINSSELNGILKKARKAFPEPKVDTSLRL